MYKTFKTETRVGDLICRGKVSYGVIKGRLLFMFFFFSFIDLLRMINVYSSLVVYYLNIASIVNFVFVLLLM